MPAALIQIIKCIHVLTAAGLLGTLIFCIIPEKNTEPHNIDLNFTTKYRLVSATMFAAVTGMLLVYPRHFTLHTAWIQAAIGGSCMTVILLLLFFPKRSSDTPLRRQLLCLMLIGLLTVIVHDAVTKHTFLLKDIQTEKTFSKI